MDFSLPTFSPGALFVPIIKWLNIHWHPFFAAINTGVSSVYDALVVALSWLPPWLFIPLAAIIVWRFIHLRSAVVVVLTLGFCLAMDMWHESLETIALVSIAVIIAVLIAFPIGVLAARHPRLQSVVRPILDIMQTVPPWVYLIPVVIFFSLGSVPSIIATIVYGAPPMVRLTTLAFKQIPTELEELGQSLGAKPFTILRKIEIPAAKPTLLVGLNQCILLSLAMVVLAGLVGSGGLGGEVTRGLASMRMGLGLRSGLGVVAVAILLDRLSRAALTKPPRRGVA